MLNVAGIVVICVLVALALAFWLAWLSARPSPRLPRTLVFGSLPQARGFEAAAERHFGNPGNVTKLKPSDRWPDSRCAGGVPLSQRGWPECP